METLSEGKIKQLAKSPAEERADITIATVLETQVIWGLAGEAGWIMMEDGEQVHLPLWPLEELVQTWVRQSTPESQPTAISLPEFIETWLPGLEKNETQVVLFPTKAGNGGLQISAAELRELLTADAS